MVMDDQACPLRSNPSRDSNCALGVSRPLRNRQQLQEPPARLTGINTGGIAINVPEPVEASRSMGAFFQCQIFINFLRDPPVAIFADVLGFAPIELGRSVFISRICFPHSASLSFFAGMSRHGNRLGASWKFPEAIAGFTLASLLRFVCWRCIMRSR